MSTSVVRKLPRRVLWSALNLLFPPRCVYCRGELEEQVAGPLFCTVCQERLFPHARPLCPRCAMPVPSIFKNNATCARCRTERLRFDQATALGIYRDDLRKAVIAMKQLQHEALTLAVGDILAGHLRNHACTTDCEAIVPMPTHWSRRMSRGMNVAELLAERVGRILHVRVADDVLKSRRKTKKQGTLSPTERRANVRGAFAVSKRYDLKDTRILLVDDVMTTGATVNEASRMLRRARAASVSVAVVARGVGVM